MRFIRIAFVFAILIVGWLIGWSNSSSLSFSFAGWSLPAMPVFVHYFVFFATGSILGVLLGRFVKRS